MSYLTACQNLRQISPSSVNETNEDRRWLTPHSVVPRERVCRELLCAAAGVCAVMVAGEREEAGVYMEAVIPTAREARAGTALLGAGGAGLWPTLRDAGALCLCLCSQLPATGVTDALLHDVFAQGLVLSKGVFLTL